MSKMQIRCADKLNTIFITEDNTYIWDLFHKNGGITAVKDRMYNIIQHLILLEEPVKLNFYKDFKYVDYIEVSVVGMDYEIKLKESRNKRSIRMQIPSKLFDINYSVSYLVNNWIKYLRYHKPQEYTYIDLLYLDIM